jgi:hypothetical protein
LSAISGSVDEEELLSKLNSAIDAFNLQKQSLKSTAQTVAASQGEASTSSATTSEITDQKTLDERVAL